MHRLRAADGECSRGEEKSIARIGECFHANALFATCARWRLHRASASLLCTSSCCRISCTSTSASRVSGENKASAMPVKRKCEPGSVSDRASSHSHSVRFPIAEARSSTGRSDLNGRRREGEKRQGAAITIACTVKQLSIALSVCSGTWQECSSSGCACAASAPVEWRRGAARAKAEERPTGGANHEEGWSFVASVCLL